MGSQFSVLCSLLLVAWLLVPALVPGCWFLPYTPIPLYPYFPYTLLSLKLGSQFPVLEFEVQGTEFRVLGSGFQFL